MGIDRKVTIITPVYNAEKDIEACLLSVAGQSYPDKEHLIVDGASTDGTLEIIKRYAEKYSHIKLISEKDDGIYDAMNKGIDQARGEWIYFLGCDDVFYDESVLDKILNLDDIDLYDVVYGNVLWGDTGEIYGGKFSLLKLMDKNICHQSIFYKLSIFDKLGKFNARYKYWADYLFNIKWFNSDVIRSKYVSSIVAKYGINGQSSQMEDIDFLRDRKSIYKQNFPVEYVVINEMLHSLELEVDQKKHQIAERDWRLAELDWQLSERDWQLSELDRQLVDRDQRIADLISSFSWRITKPLRWLNAIISTKFKERIK